MFAVTHHVTYIILRSSRTIIPPSPCRFTSAVVYQGLIMRLGILEGNVYIDFLISGLVEFPAAFLILFTIERIGRRLPFATANIIAGTACFITAFIPDSKGTREDEEQAIQTSSDYKLFEHFCLSLQVCCGSRHWWPASVGSVSPWPLRWWCLLTRSSTQHSSGNLYKLYLLFILCLEGLQLKVEKVRLDLVINELIVISELVLVIQLAPKSKGIISAES